MNDVKKIQKYIIFNVLTGKNFKIYVELYRQNALQ